ncbi:MAG: DUF1211 domain-containing protein [Caulobacteraceae bacterium]|nr:DUF1211 domain-containing protein [Caulobacteraceae bacterium]
MGDHHETPDDNATRQFERVVFFSDAVFAIAITLLVLTLKAPVGAHGEPRLDLVIPNILGFLLSFYVIGIFWQGHHTLFGLLEREDQTLRRTNLVLLSTIVFLPFPTSVLSEFPNSTTTIVFYAASAATVGLAQAGLILAARRPGIMRPEELALGAGRMISRPLSASLVFLASIPLAFVDSRRAPLFWILIVPVRGLISRIWDRVDQRKLTPAS